MMSPVTRERVLERITGFGLPLENFFIIANDENDPQGVIAFWHPEVGLRGLIIEKDDLARGVYNYLLREAKVRRFKSWQELTEAMYKEKWEGWDTCDDYRRTQQAMDELAKRGKKK
jgi:hypothetical protein